MKYFIDLLKKKKFILLLILILCFTFFLSGCGHTDSGYESRYDDTITVLCYGDSNTYGYKPGTNGERYPDDVRWTNLLGEKLGSGYYVINEGLSGRTTAYDRPNAEWKNGLTTLIPVLGTDKPVDIIVFMLGTNDCMSVLELEPEDIASGMESLVVTAKETLVKQQGYEPEIIIVVPAALDPDYEDTPFESLYDDASIEKSRALAPLYEEVAEANGCILLDETDNEVSELDCVHLTESGHKELAEDLYNLIIQIGL